MHRSRVRCIAQSETTSYLCRGTSTEHRGEDAPRSSQRSIGRHRLTIERWNRQIEPDDDREQRWELFYKTPYTELIGSRLLRLRQGRGLSQSQVRHSVRRPRGGPYSQSLISRLERGYANAPIYVYTHLAGAFDLAPEVLLGPDDALKPVGEAEMTLLRVLRRLSIAPDEALSRIVRGRG